ncbi:hypothetical protein ACX0G7_14890 [Flavitalea antarctica]
MFFNKEVIVFRPGSYSMQNKTLEWRTKRWSAEQTDGVQNKPMECRTKGVTGRVESQGIN